MEFGLSGRLCGGCVALFIAPALIELQAAQRQVRDANPAGQRTGFAGFGTFVFQRRRVETAKARRP